LTFSELYFCATHVTIVPCPWLIEVFSFASLDFDLIASFLLPSTALRVPDLVRGRDPADRSGPRLCSLESKAGDEDGLSNSFGKAGFDVSMLTSTRTDCSGATTERLVQESVRTVTGGQGQRFSFVDPDLLAKKLNDYFNFAPFDLPSMFPTQDNKL